MAADTAKKVQIIVYIEFALLGLGLLGLFFSIGFRESILDRLVDGAEYYEYEEMKSQYRRNINQAIAFTVATLICSIVMMALLFVGFRRKDDTKLDGWLIIHGFIFILLGFGVVYAIKSAPGALSPKNNVQTIIYVAYRIWSLIIVNRYIKELREPPLSPEETPEAKDEA